MVGTPLVIVVFDDGGGNFPKRRFPGSSIASLPTDNHIRSQVSRPSMINLIAPIHLVHHRLTQGNRI